MSQYSSFYIYIYIKYHISFINGISKELGNYIYLIILIAAYINIYLLVRLCGTSKLVFLKIESSYTIKPNSNFTFLFLIKSSSVFTKVYMKKTRIRLFNYSL